MSHSIYLFIYKKEQKQYFVRPINYNKILVWGVDMMMCFVKKCPNHGRIIEAIVRNDSLVGIAFFPLSLKKQKAFVCVQLT